MPASAVARAVAHAVLLVVPQTRGGGLKCLWGGDGDDAKHDDSEVNRCGDGGDGGVDVVMEAVVRMW